jgi:hypothetical protein
MLVEVPAVGKIGDRLSSYFPDFGKFDGCISDTKAGGFRFWGHSRYGQICRWVAPVALTDCRQWPHRWVRPKIYSLADLLGGLMSTINAATICIAAVKANGTT